MERRRPSFSSIRDDEEQFVSTLIKLLLNRSIDNEVSAPSTNY